MFAGTRPKRGKYRNYDRDSLVEAVRAVQRGEMSVHRAGSYYGVPHSTLEYKVKERHLMRPRKRDPKPNPVDEKIASLKQNDLKIAQVNIILPLLNLMIIMQFSGKTQTATATTTAAATKRHQTTSAEIPCLFAKRH